MAQQQFTCVFVIALLLVIGQVNCHLPAGFERCDSTKAEVRNFSVSACPGGVASGPCKMKRNQDVTFALDFTSATDFEDVHMHMVVTKFDYMEEACMFSNLQCPGKVGQSQSVKQTIRIDERLPPRQSDMMQFYLAKAGSDDPERIVCIRFPVTIA